MPLVFAGQGESDYSSFQDLSMKNNRVMILIRNHLNKPKYHEVRGEIRLIKMMVGDRLPSVSHSVYYFQYRTSGEGDRTNHIAPIKIAVHREK
jgi:hypothetical protein